MKKLIIFLLMMCGCCGVKAAGLDGKYLSQSGELMFVFKGDSLYVDVAQSMRNLSAFKLVKNSENKATTSFNAYETYLKNGAVTYREVLIRVTRLDDKRYLLEYFGKDKDRDYNTAERYHLKKLE